MTPLSSASDPLGCFSSLACLPSLFASHPFPWRRLRFEFRHLPSVPGKIYAKCSSWRSRARFTLKSQPGLWPKSMRQWLSCETEASSAASFLLPAKSWFVEGFVEPEASRLDPASTFFGDAIQHADR